MPATILLFFELFMVTFVCIRNILLATIRGMLNPKGARSVVILQMVLNMSFGLA